MKLNIDMIPSKKFHYVKDMKTFVSEASDLKGYNPMRRCFDDACDVGFDMVSQWTGRTKRFFLVNERESSEGEVEGWDFQDHEGNFKVVIFND